MSRHRVAALALATATCVALAGCGVPAEASPRVIGESRLPESLHQSAATTTTVGVAREDVRLWFVRDDRLVKVTHQIEPPVDPQSVVGELTAGPSEAEQRDSLRSAIPDPEVIVDVDVQGGTATIKLDDAFEQVPTADQVLAIGQLVLTMTDLRGVGQVRFDLGGAEVAVPVPDGGTSSGPVSADDFQALVAT